MKYNHLINLVRIMDWSVLRIVESWYDPAICFLSLIRILRVYIGS